jgi:hypothetical protein
MSLVDVGPILYPNPNRLLAISSFSTNVAYQINASGSRIAWVTRLKRSGTITHVGLRINACATPVVSRLGLYAVDGNQYPTSTGYGGSSYGTFTPAANTYSEVALGTSATATMGDVVGIVVEFDSTAGDFFLSPAGGATYGTAGAFFAKHNGTSWSRGSFSAYPCLHVRYSDGFIADVEAVPATGITGEVTTFNTGSTPDEYANRFTLPFACRIAGIWHNMRTPNASGDYECILYSGTTALRTAAVDAEYTGGTTGGREIPFASGYVAAAGETVRAAVRAATATNLTYRRTSLFAADYATAIGLRAGDCESSRSDLGSWSDTGANLGHIGLIIDQLDDGAGGGGGLMIHPGMAGGMRG